MYNVWKGDKNATIQFIIEYLAVNKQVFKTWNNLTLDKKKEERKQMEREAITGVLKPDDIGQGK